MIVDAVASLGGEPFFMDDWGELSNLTKPTKSSIAAEINITIFTHVNQLLLLFRY
jgi:hypothetical protein